MPALARRLGLFTFGFLALTAISCSDAAEVDVNALVQLELDASYPEPFSYLSGVREMSDGRILAADPLGQVLLSIDLESGAADTIGGVGGGPGEYEQPDRVFALPGDSTLLVDLGNARLTVIDPDMAFVEGVSMAQQTESGSMLLLLPRFVDALGRVYFQGQSLGMGASMPDSAHIARYDRGTGAVDTMGMVKLPEMERETTGAGMVSIGPRPMTPQDEWAVGPDGTAAVVRASDYSVDYYRPDGAFVDGPPNTAEPLSVGQAEKEEWVNGMGADGISVGMMMNASGGRSISLSRGGMGMGGGAPSASASSAVQALLNQITPASGWSSWRPVATNTTAQRRTWGSRRSSRQTISARPSVSASPSATSASYALTRAFDFAWRARGLMRIHSNSRCSVRCRALACFSSLARRSCFCSSQPE